MRVAPATSADLPAVRAAYADGRALQRAQGAVVWPEFPDDAIVEEMAAGRLLRIVDGDAVAGVFSVAYEDPAIWGRRERGAHVYLHRIARAVGHGGRGLTEIVVAWAHARCRELGRTGVRMDTWASNAVLIAYYRRLGFRLVARRRIASDPRLPPHYHGLELALLEQPCAGASPRDSAAGREPGVGEPGVRPSRGAPHTTGRRIAGADPGS